MRRFVLLSSTTACCCLGLLAPAFAAPPAASAVVSAPPAATTTAAVPKPAEACLSDVKAFHEQMQKDGYWLGGSDYGYGYPIGGYGYGYPMGEYPGGTTGVYQNARPGYKVRNLLAAAAILGRDGQQATCEAVLTTTRDIYKQYAAELHRNGVTMADGPNWQQRQIAAAQPITGKTIALRSDQLLDTDVRSPKDESLGSIHDLVLDPKTGKIAYLIVARGGLFGFDKSYVPIPWDDFKLTPSVSLLVLDTNKAAMDAAPQITDDQFTTPGQFEQESRKVDAYWKTHLSSNAATPSKG